MRYEPSISSYQYDWRWAVGATPWGPYSNFSGVSELMQVRRQHAPCRLCLAARPTSLVEVQGGGVSGGRATWKRANLHALALRTHLWSNLMAPSHHHHHHHHDTHKHTPRPPCLQNIARRNSLLAHVGAALRQLQHQLDAVDAFVYHHFQGPWEEAGLRDAHRHWLDTVARCAQTAGLAAI